MRKELLSLLLFVVAGLSAVQAYDFSAVVPSGQTLYYNIISDSTVEITSRNSSSPYYTGVGPVGTLVISDTVTYSGTTYSVTSIGNYAFFYCSGLTSVTIPNSVTSIGNNAFYNVRHIIYNGTATGSQWGALSVNGYIEGDFVYANNTKTSLLAYIGTSTSVTIPNSVTSIEYRAFYDCSGLTSVTIPNSVTSIGSCAFYYCSGLTSVTIPNSVTSIGNNAFYDVRHIIYNGTATGSPWGALSVNGYIEGDFVYANNTKTSLLAYIGTSTSVTIPNSVTSIGEYAFFYCSGLTSVTIPNSITTIGSSAFSGCSGLTSVTIPNSVTSIGEYAFYGCTGLTSVTIPNSVTSIGEYAFYYCSGLTSVTIPNAVDTIYDYTFYNCTSLTSVTIPNSVTTIEYRAFYNCSGLTSVTIPNSITTIGSYAFSGCSGLTSVTIGNSVTSIGNYAFRNCSGLTSVTIPNSVTSIGDNAFYSCSNISNVYVKGINPPSIEYNTFPYLDSARFYVPCQSVSTYKNTSNWSGLSSLIYGKNFWEYSYDFVVNDSTLGSVSFTEIDCDSNVVVTVSENVGYRLIGWSDGGTGNPRTFHLTGDTMVTAILDYIPYSVIVQPNDTIMGTVIGGGEYKPNSSATVAAISANGYQFTNWSNSSTLNPYTFTVTKDTNLVAYFEEIIPDTAFVHDTTYVPVHDTTYITQIDTVTNTVYDTITNTVYDTITNTVYDTTYVPIHDTTYITQIDTVTNTVYDTITNTVYDTITNTVYDTTYITQIDTVINTVHDTVTNTVYDTVTNTVYDTIDNFVYDTVYITETDTLWLFDTIYMHDTIYIYDTIYIRDSTTGIEDVSVINAKIYSSRSRIVVEGAEGNSVMLFDMQGRLLATKRDEYSVLEFEVPISGAYFVKIGNYKAKKVVVIK